MPTKAMPAEQQNTGVSTPPDWALRQLLSEAIKRSGKKRPQIAEEMTALLGVRVTEHMLNDFTSKSKCAARFPAAFVKAFCYVVGSSSLQIALADDDDLRLMKLGIRVGECRELVSQIAALLDQITAPDVQQIRPPNGKRR
jgi:hypothetical protein